MFSCIIKGSNVLHLKLDFLRGKFNRDIRKTYTEMLLKQAANVLAGSRRESATPRPLLLRRPCVAFREAWHGKARHGAATAATSEVSRHVFASWFLAALVWLCEHCEIK